MNVCLNLERSRMIEVLQEAELQQNKRKVALFVALSAGDLACLLKQSLVHDGLIKL